MHNNNTYRVFWLIILALWLVIAGLVLSDLFAARG